MKIKYLGVLVLLLIAIFMSVAGLVDAQSTTNKLFGSQYYQPGFQSFNSERGLDYSSFWPGLGGIGKGGVDGNLCEARQDLILEILPGSCSPSVVRSDLLESQNVPVFCPVTAVKLNPLIDIGEIGSVSFAGAGGLPENVQGISFYPYRVAVTTKDNLFASPGVANIGNNLGYAVVVLKQTPKESDMPEEIAVNLTANIRYSVKKVFGAGRNEFFLQELSDEEWNAYYKEYGFFKGNAYLRLDELSVDGNEARISIYKDADTKINSLSLKKGGQSNIIYLPGFYCSAGVRVKFTGAEVPKQKVKLQVDNDYVWLYEGQKFLDNQCIVRSISITERAKNNGLEKAVARISCPKNNFDLEISELDQSLGTQNLRWEDVLKDVAPEEQKKIKENFEKAKEDAFLISDLYTSEKRPAEEGGEFYGLSDLQEVAELARNLGQFRTELEVHEKIISKYPGTSAELASQERINALKKIDYKKSRAFTNINFAVHSISFSNYKYPAVSDASVKFDKPGSDEFRVNQFIYSYKAKDSSKIDETDETWAKIREIRADSIILQVKITEINAQTGQPSVRAGNYVMKEGQTLGSIEGLNLPGLNSNNNLRLEKINLKQEVKIEVVPEVPKVGTTGNFTFRVGIEKRSLKISPEKTEEMIKNINESIKKWSEITKNLGEAVKVGKAACFAGSTALFVKNFIANTGGGASARTEVMRGYGGNSGWFAKCDRLARDSPSQYKSPDDCLLKNNDLIEEDVRKQKEAESYANNQFDMIYNKDDVQGSQQNFVKVFASDVCSGRLKDRKVYIDSTGGYKPLCGSNGVFKDEAAVLKAYNEGAFTISDAKAVMSASQVYDGGSINSSIDTLGAQRLNGFFTNMYGRPQTVPDGTNDIQGLKALNMQSVNPNFGREIYAQSYVIKDAVNLGGSKQLLAGRYIKMPVYRGVASGGGSSGQSGQDALSALRGRTVLIPVTDPSENNGVIGLDKNNLASARVINENGGIETHQFTEEEYNAILRSYNIGVMREIPSSQSSCSNAYRNPKVKYFSSGQYAGLPAVVPLGPVAGKEGWYVATKDSEIAPYTEAGQLRTFWLCNVGKNGNEEFDSGVGDDKETCFQINLDKGTPLDQSYCFSEQETRQAISRAQQAIREAGKYDQGRKQVSILGRNYDIERVASSAVGTQCQDFMSASDCNIMFNLCDPVLCPSSRCDLGGTYRVDDVVQSGIIGSIALCLPNAKEGIYVPVCLTGIYAGLDAYTSVLRAHRDCLQESLDTGQYVGLCDEVRSVYMCEFFWKQATPLVKAGIPKLIEGLTGAGSARAGGEYTNFQKAWDNADKSFNYFTQTYGANAFAAFKARSTADIGSDVCKMFVSANYPDSGDIFDALVKPESPVQFYAEFDEIPFSEATVPPTSQYNVFYHVYAGRDRGVYYTVYLKNPPQSGLYSGQDRINVKQGFIPLGKYDSQKLEFTAPSGYKELCVNINGKDECGFEKVSTSYAVNHLSDKFAEEQAVNKQVTKEEQCINGDSSIYSAVDFNLGDAASGYLNPEMYKKGIIRICSAKNPGQDRGEDTILSARWQDVGYCESPTIRCWLDTESVKNVIKDKGIESRTLQQVNAELTQQSPLQVQQKLDGVLNEIKSKLAVTTDPLAYASYLDQLALVEQQQAPTSTLKVRAADMKYRIYADITKIAFTKEIDRITSNVNTAAAKSLADARKDCRITGYSVPSSVRAGQPIPLAVSLSGECKYWKSVMISVNKLFFDGASAQVSGNSLDITQESARAGRAQVSLAPLDESGKYYLDLELYYLETGEGRGNQRFSEIYSGKGKAGQEFMVAVDQNVQQTTGTSIDCEVTDYLLSKNIVKPNQKISIGIVTKGECKNWNLVTIEARNYDTGTLAFTSTKEITPDTTVFSSEYFTNEGKYLFLVYPENPQMIGISGQTYSKRDEKHTITITNSDAVTTDQQTTQDAQQTQTSQTQQTGQAQTASAVQINMEKETTRDITKGSMYPVIVLYYDGYLDDYIGFRWNTNLGRVQAVMMSNFDISQFFGGPINSFKWDDSSTLKNYILTTMGSQIWGNLDSDEQAFIKAVLEKSANEEKMIDDIKDIMIKDDDFIKFKIWNPRFILYSDREWLIESSGSKTNLGITTAPDGSKLSTATPDFTRNSDYGGFMSWIELTSGEGKLKYCEAKDKLGQTNTQTKGSFDCVKFREQQEQRKRDGALGDPNQD